MRYLIFQREDCHLCEQAETVLLAAGIKVESIDISGDAELNARYGKRIPVLRDTETERELNWPFDVKAVLIFQVASNRSVGSF